MVLVDIYYLRYSMSPWMFRCNRISRTLVTCTASCGVARPAQHSCHVSINIYCLLITKVKQALVWLQEHQGSIQNIIKRVDLTFENEDTAGQHGPDFAVVSPHPLSWRTGGGEERLLLALTLLNWRSSIWHGYFWKYAIMDFLCSKISRESQSLNRKLLLLCYSKALVTDFQKYQCQSWETLFLKFSQFFSTLHECEDRRGCEVWVGSLVPRLEAANNHW